MKRAYTQLPYTEYPTTAFDANRTPIDRVVLHSTAGTLQAALNTFSSPTAQTSAHYIIDNDGKLWAGLEEYNVSYANGNYPMNQRSVTIEHVDEGANVKLHTDAQYTMSAKLVKDICTFYGLPINSTTIIPHNQVVATACPNGLDVNRIIREANGSTPPTDDCPLKLKQVTEERDRLNGVITGKDQEITTCNSSLASLTAEKNSLAVQLDACQRDKALYKEAYDALPLLKDQVTELERQKQVWMDKEIQLGKEYKALQTRYLKLKKPGLKFMQDALIRLCEKMGVEL